MLVHRINRLKFRSSRNQLGCTIGAVSAQWLVEYVKKALKNITTEGMKHIVLYVLQFVKNLRLLNSVLFSFYKTINFAPSSVVIVVPLLFALQGFPLAVTPVTVTQ